MINFDIPDDYEYDIFERVREIAEWVRSDEFWEYRYHTHPMIVSAEEFDRLSSRYEFTCSKCGDEIAVYGIFLGDALAALDREGWWSLGLNRGMICKDCNI